ETEPGRVNFLSHRGSLNADLDHNVAGLLLDLDAAPLGTRAETLERGALVDVDGFHLQLVDIGTVVMLGIRDGGFDRLLDDAGRFLGRKRENVDSLGNR